jgi:hypothetical protein
MAINDKSIAGKAIKSPTSPSLIRQILTKEIPLILQMTLITSTEDRKINQKWLLKLSKLTIIETYKTVALNLKVNK